LTELDAGACGFITTRVLLQLLGYPACLFTAAAAAAAAAVAAAAVSLAFHT
jgi:hypothetical protein